MGFKYFESAKRAIAGVEMIRMIRMIKKNQIKLIDDCLMDTELCLCSTIN
jgi:hypothetical protein